jgi:hypothetical protein
LLTRARREPQARDEPVLAAMVLDYLKASRAYAGPSEAPKIERQIGYLEMTFGFAAVD